MVPLSAYPQTTLTGAIQFATDSTGAFSLNQSWNTLGGDLCWDLWLAQNPDASSPVNGPSDAQAAINIPLAAGNSYRFYIFGAPDLSISFNRLESVLRRRQLDSGHLGIRRHQQQPVFTEYE
jgi:hypothetical protein